MARVDELRLITRAAHMYYQEGIRQADIATRLQLSQSTVSRLLRRAMQESIVRFSINVPKGIYLELENLLCAKYGIKEVIIADCMDDSDEASTTAIASAGAFWLENALAENEVIGISSWSSTLQRLVEHLHPFKYKRASRVVQLLGGMGFAQAQLKATEMAVALAHMTGAKAELLAAPCITGSRDSRAILLGDDQTHKTLSGFCHITLALVGIGSVLPSRNLVSSGNSFSDPELAHLAQLGAVGDILLRFYRSDGQPVQSHVDERVIGMPLPDLKKVNRVVGLAGGRHKIAAIAGALRGKLLSTLITDCHTAQRLADFRL